VPLARWQRAGVGDAVNGSVPGSLGTLPAGR
jgi:hypothetical protein